MSSAAKRQRLHAKSDETNEASCNEAAIAAKADPENEDLRLRSFLEWCQNAGMDVSEKVTVARQGSCHNYGMVAVANIAEGETLFAVPRAILLHPDNCSVSALLEKGKDELRSDSGWVPLLLCLMAEYTSTDSPWRPYLDICPDFSQLDPPMFWDREMVTRELQGTGVPEATERDARDVQREYTTVAMPFMKKNPQQFDLGIHTLDLYRKMVAFVMAYSFTEPRTSSRDHREEMEDDRDEEGGDCSDGDAPGCHDDGEEDDDDSEGGCCRHKSDSRTDANDDIDEESEDYSDDDRDHDDHQDESVQATPIMVPMADILNHIAKNNASLQFGKTSLRMVATKNIQKNEEVFNTYGEMANWQLLHMYGFAEAYPENIYDTVDLPVTLLEDQSESCLDGGSALARAKRELIDSGEQEELPNAVIVGREGIMNKYETLELLKVLSLTSAEFERHRSFLDGEDDEDVEREEWLAVEENVEHFFSFDGLAKLPSPWKRLLSASAKEHMKTYPSPLKETERARGRTAAAGSRLQHAQHVRTGQWMLLQRLVQSVEGSEVVMR